MEHVVERVEYPSSSKKTPGEKYIVVVVDGMTNSCDCPDYYYRSKNAPGRYLCKHMRAEEEKRRQMAIAFTILKTARPLDANDKVRETALPQQYPQGPRVFRE